MVNALLKDEKNKTEEWYLNTVFLLLLFIFLYTRYLIFFSANLMVDSDQPFMWLGTKDYASGHFYEPRFYGQDYNTFFEALVAVPFYKLGLPVYYALPLATHFLFIFPVVFTAVVLFSKNLKVAAILFLCVFNALTLAYDIMSSLPRGFVPGIFFCSFFILSYLNPTSIKYAILNCILFLTGFFVNPNIILIAAPMFAWLLYYNFRRPAFYLAMVLSSLVVVPLYFLMDWFYDKHPDYVVYGLVHSFSIKYFLENINHLDQAFGHVSFFTEDNCTMLLIVLCVLLVAAALTRKKDALFVISVFITVLFLSLVTGKTREGSNWPYYSFSRMYVAIPFFIALTPALLKVRSQTILFFVLFLSLTFSGYKLAGFNNTIAFHTDHHHAAGVRIVPLATIKEGMEVYSRIAHDNKCDHLIVSNIFWQGPYLVYGGPVLYPDFPSTEESNADHRYWVREYEKNKIYPRFMVISINYSLDKITAGKYPFKISKIDDWGVFVIEDNHMKNGDFLQLLRSIEA